MLASQKYVFVIIKETGIFKKKAYTKNSILRNWTQQLLSQI